MVKIKLTKKSRIDLQAIENFIAEDNPSRAKSFVEEIMQSFISTVGEFPLSSYIPSLLGNAGVLSLTEFTRQGAVCREWLAIRNNCNAVLCFQANSKNCISK